MNDLVAYASRPKLIVALLSCVLMVYLGLYFVGLFGPPRLGGRSGLYTSEASLVIGWLFGAPAIIFFSFCGLVSLKLMFEGGEVLRIGADGIRWTRWSLNTIPWQEITEVTTWGTGNQKRIVLHLRNAGLFPGRGIYARFAAADRRMTGGDIAVAMNGTNRSPDDAMDAITRFRQTSVIGAPEFGRRRSPTAP